MRLMKPLAIRLGGQTTSAKSLVMPRYSDYKGSGVEGLGEVPRPLAEIDVKLKQCSDRILSLGVAVYISANNTPQAYLPEHRHDAQTGGLLISGVCNTYALHAIGPDTPAMPLNDAHFGGFLFQDAFNDN